MKRVLLLLCGLLLPTLPMAQERETAPPIAVTLIDGKTVALEAKTILALPRLSETATAHEKTATYTGTDLRDVLRDAGVEPLESLRGAALRRVITVVAADGYRAVFTLSEMDPTIGARRVLLVDRENGATLPKEDGPWRLIVAGDQRPARWVRQVTGVVVSDVP